MEDLWLDRIPVTERFCDDADGTITDTRKMPGDKCITDWNVHDCRAVVM